MRLSWIIPWALNPMTNVLVRRDTQRRDSWKKGVGGQAETERCSQEEAMPGAQELGEAGRTLPWHLHRDRGPANTWIWDFWLQSCERINS